MVDEFVRSAGFTLAARRTLPHVVSRTAPAITHPFPADSASSNWFCQQIFPFETGKTETVRLCTNDLLPNLTQP